MAAKSPITEFDAPSFSAKATRKAPPVNVLMALVARPDLMTALRPAWTSSSVKLSLGFFPCI